MTPQTLDAAVDAIRAMSWHRQDSEDDAVAAVRLLCELGLPPADAWELVTELIAIGSIECCGY